MMNNEKEKDAIDTSKLDEILPKYDPLKLNSINLAQNYVSAFNTGMNIYQCVNQLQGYIEWVVKAVNDVVKSWNVQVGESIDQSKAIVRETTTEQFNTEWTNKQPELIEQVNTLTTNQFNEDWGVLENRINTTLENQNTNIENIQNEQNELETNTNNNINAQNTKINSIQTQQTNLANQQTNLANEQTTLSNRMDTFTSLSAGSTTGDAELQDIRVGANGVTYNNAGDAVRGQYSQLKEDLDEIFKLEFKTGRYTVGGNELSDEGWTKCVNYIPIDCVKEISLPIYQGTAGIQYFDENLQFVGCEQGTKPSEATVITQLTHPENAVFFKFCYFNNDANKYKIILKDMLEKAYVDAISEKAFNEKYGNTVKYASFIANKGALSTVSNYGLAFNKLLRPKSKIKISQRLKNIGSNILYLAISTSHEILKVINKTTYFSGINTFDLDFLDVNESFYLCIKIPSDDLLYFDNDTTTTNTYTQWNATWFEGNNLEVGQTVTFKYSPGSKHSYNISFDVFTSNLDVLTTLNSNKSIYIVDKNGNGDFKTINEAVNYCKPIATKENRITIQINPGIYDEVVLVDDSWLSFVGTNRDTCIIRDTSGKYANSPMRITGDFYLANLTFIANADNVDPNWSPTGYNPGGSVVLDYPSYALHIDGDTSHVDSVGRIVNCSFYSECFQAIGIGLHNTQTLIIENCSIVRNTTRDDFLDNQYNGAIGCHSTLNENEKYQSFILENCDIKYNHDYALQLYKYHSTSPMTVKCVGNTLESGGSNLVYFRNCTNEIITSTSHGNNSHDINKFS